MTRARLSLLCGLPGSGKTTLSRRLVDETGATRLDCDEVMTAWGVDLWDDGFRTRLEGHLRGLAERLLLRGDSVVLEWGFWSRAERDDLRARGEALGAAVDLYVFDLDVDELARRTAQRRRLDPDGAPDITRDHLLAWHELFEVPDESERSRYDRVIDVAANSDDA